MTVYSELAEENASLTSTYVYVKQNFCRRVLRHTAALLVAVLTVSIVSISPASAAGDYGSKIFDPDDQEFTDTDSNGTFKARVNYASDRAGRPVNFAFVISPYLRTIATSPMTCRAWQIKDGAMTGHQGGKSDLPPGYTFHWTFPENPVGSNMVVQGACTFHVNVAGKNGLANVEFIFRYVVTVKNIIHNGESGYCLGIHAGSTSPGKNAVVGPCTSDSSQAWYEIATAKIEGKIYHQFRNSRSGLCLAVEGSSMSGGASIVQEPCKGISDHSQFWRNVYISKAFYNFVNGHSGLCMGIHNSSIAAGFVVQGACAHAPTQSWYTS